VGNGKGFDTDDNALSLYWKGGKQELPKAPKLQIARQLVDVIAAHYKKK
jgi:phosphopantothenoylcysteine decarboxylase/phosphopantothenate--cysteine ligase